MNQATYREIAHIATHLTPVLDIIERFPDKAHSSAFVGSLPETGRKKLIILTQKFHVDLSQIPATDVIR